MDAPTNVTSADLQLTTTTPDSLWSLSLDSTYCHPIEGTSAHGPSTQPIDFGRFHEKAKLKLNLKNQFQVPVNDVVDVDDDDDIT